MEKQKELDIKTKYNFTQSLIVKKIDDNILVISPENANWLLLKNQEQLDILNLLREQSIEKTLLKMELLKYNTDNLIYVLTEIEAKKFLEGKKTKDSTTALFIYLTNKCNLKCPHCYMYAGDEFLNEMTTEEIFFVLRSFTENGGKLLTLSGGEVTERQDLFEIVQFAHDLGLTTTLLSNGTNWTKELIIRISENIDEIQISVDGYNEATNAVIRGKGSFFKSIHTIDEFYKTGVKVTVAITPIPPIKKEEYIQFAKTLLTKYSSDRFSIKFTYELINGRDNNVTNIDNKKYREIIDEITEELYPNNKIEKFVLNHKNDLLLNNCGYGGITVSSNGNIYFCNRIFQLKKYGNIRETDFKEFLKLSRWVQNITGVDNIYPCKNCEIKYICGGGCRVEEIPDMINIEPFSDNKENYTMTCNSVRKTSIYKKMIEANELFYY